MPKLSGDTHKRYVNDEFAFYLEILDDITREPHQALMSVFRQETAQQLKGLGFVTFYLGTGGAYIDNLH